MNNISTTLAAAWRIAAPYFRSEDKWAGRGLLAAVIAIELATVYLTVLFNQWNNVFYNAIQQRNQAVFTYQIGYFCVLAAFWVGLKVYQLYLNQWLQIRWRNWMTNRYLAGWVHDANHYRMQLLGDAADNPDQRITDDTKRYVEQTMELGIGMLNAVVTIASFIVILWTLSNEAPLHLFGYDIAIPGYLVWASLIYAGVGTALTHLIGRPLVLLNFQQQRYEADFRFNLVRVRENGEQIALLHGEPVEQARLQGRFALVYQNWLEIMQRTKRLIAFTASYQQAAVIFPYVLIGPAYFANKVQLGGMQQTLSAFSSMQDALSFIVTAYRTLAEWQSVVERLSGFEASIRDADALAARDDIIHVTEGGKPGIELEKLLVTLPNGVPLMTSDGFKVAGGERTLLTGPSGSGKSTLFRAIAGIWPFGRGSIEIPAQASLMMLPQRPYFPVGSLIAAVAYPAPENAFERAELGDALVAVGLPKLASRLDEEAHWNRILSLGEQQRLGIARALLLKPQYLFLDEATASLDEPSEAALYRLLEQKLPATTIVSIGHRSTLEAFHRRNVALTRDGELFALQNGSAAS